MKKIKKLAVWYEDGTMEFWTGSGALKEIHTYTPKAGPDEKDLPIFYIDAMISPATKIEEDNG